VLALRWAHHIMVMYLLNSVGCRVVQGHVFKPSASHLGAFEVDLRAAGLDRAIELLSYRAIEVVETTCTTTGPLCQHAEADTSTLTKH
jgi:hypothetical protein